MPNEVMVNDLIELEAYAEGLREKARAIRLKMEGEVKKKKVNITHEKMKADFIAHRLKVDIRARARMEEKRKKT